MTDEEWSDFIREHTPLVHQVIRKHGFFTFHADKDDLISVGQWALVEAKKAFDEEKGVPFPAFCKTVIRYHIVKFTKRFQFQKSALLNNAVRIDSTNEEDEDDWHYLCDISGQDYLPFTYQDPFKQVVLHELTQDFHTFLHKNIKEPHLTVYTLQNEGYTYDEISDKLGMTKKEIDNMLYRTREKIKKKWKTKED